MIYYFDTNVLIYLITEKGEFSKKVWEFLNSLKKEDLVVIPTITILEAAHVLQKFKNVDRISTLLELVEDFEIMEFSFEDVLGL